MFFLLQLKLKYRHHHPQNIICGTLRYRIEFKDQSRSRLCHNYGCYTLIVSVIDPLTMQGDRFDSYPKNSTPGFKCMTKVGCHSLARTSITHKPPIRLAGRRMCQLDVTQQYKGVTFHPACGFIKISQVFFHNVCRHVTLLKKGNDFHPLVTHWEITTHKY